MGTDAVTDRELIEAAAKAAGVIAEWHNDDDADFDAAHEGMFLKGERGPDNSKYWNPLTDDGDALRLAVKLKMDLLRADDCIEAQCGDLIERDGEELYAFGIEPLGADPAAATRRAIVRAAAALAGTAPGATGG